MNPAVSLDATFAALADPTRRAIVSRLAVEDATVLELAAPFQISLAAISRHLKVLERAGLISRGKDAQWRPSRLRLEMLREVTAWVEHTREAWESRFDQLNDYLHEMEAEEARKTAKPENNSNPANEGDIP